MATFDVTLTPNEDCAYRHFQCPSCGRLHTLPYDERDTSLPWCIHGGASEYVWPRPGDVERYSEDQYNDWAELRLLT